MMPCPRCGSRRVRHRSTLLLGRSKPKILSPYHCLDCGYIEGVTNEKEGELGWLLTKIEILKTQLEKLDLLDLSIASCSCVTVDFEDAIDKLIAKVKELNEIKAKEN